MPRGCIPPSPSGVQRPMVQATFGVQPEERGLGLLKDSTLPKTKTNSRKVSPQAGGGDWLWAPHLFPGRVVRGTDDPP